MGMIRAERLLLDHQRALEERLCLLVLALGAVKLREVVQAGGDSGMSGPERLLGDPLCLLRHLAGALI